MLTRFRRHQQKKAFHHSQYRSTVINPPAYQPANQKASDFHKSQAKVNLLPGGNQSSKTTTVAHDHVMYARGKKDTGCQGIALTNTYDDIGKNLWPHYKECLHPAEWDWIKGNQKEDNPKIIQLKSNGYRFYFGSYEQGRKAHQGAKWDYAHFDEECPPDIFVEVYRGCLARKARIGYSYTPLEGYDYLEELIEKGRDPDELNYWTPAEPMTLLENPHVPQEEKDAWIAMLGESAQRTRIYGYKGTCGFLVYEGFSKERHVITPFPIPPDWKFYRCIDYGWDHPTVSLILATDGYKMYVVSEYYQNRRLVDEHVKHLNRQHKELLIKDKQFDWQKPSLIGISDHDAQLRAEYERRGIFTQPAQKDRIKGCEVVRNLVETDRLLIFSSCKKTIWEFGKYHLPGPDKKGILKPGEKADDPIKEYDDCMDCIRYGCVEEFGYVSWNPAFILSG